MSQSANLGVVLKPISTSKLAPRYFFQATHRLHLHFVNLHILVKMFDDKQSQQVIGIITTFNQLKTLFTYGTKHIHCPLLE